MRWYLLLVASAASAQTNPRAAMQASLDKQRASAEIQRTTVRQQMTIAAQFQGSPPVSSATPMAEPECPALPEMRITPILESASKAHHVPVDLLRAMVRQESGFRPCA